MPIVLLLFSSCNKQYSRVLKKKVSNNRLRNKNILVYYDTKSHSTLVPSGLNFSQLLKAFLWRGSFLWRGCNYNLPRCIGLEFFNVLKY